MSLEDDINDDLNGLPHNGNPGGGGGGAIPRVNPTREQIASSYQKWLGRDPESEGAFANWLTNPGYDYGISSSPEAQAYKNRAAAPAAPAGGGAAPAGGGGGVPGGNYQAWFQSLTNGKPANSDTLKSLEGTLNQNGVSIAYNAAGIAHKIKLPNGEIVRVGDHFDSAPSEGFTTAWTWVGGGGGGGGVSGGGNNTLSTPQTQPTFDDPAGSLLEQLALDRVNRLSQNPDRSNLDAYVQMLIQNQEANKQRAGEMAGTFRTRATELNQPAYSTGDEAVLRARMFDGFERRRQETLKNDREGVYARGFAPTSGIVQDVQNRTNDRYEQARTGMESDLLASMMEETQRRRDHAVQLETMAQQALEGGDISSLSNQAQIADLEDQMIQDANQRERERLSTAAIPEDMTTNRTQLALQILGQGGNPSSVLNSILGLGQYGQNARALNLQNKNSNMAGLGSLASLAMGILNYAGKDK